MHQLFSLNLICLIDINWQLDDNMKVESETFTKKHQNENFINDDEKLTLSKKSKKLKHVIHSSCILFKTMKKKFIIRNYALYDSDNSLIISSVNHLFIKFDDFKNYALYINADLKDIKDVLISCVHLDDLTILHVIEKFNSWDLNKNWSVDFDQANMIRVIHMSLSNAIKIWVSDEYVNVNEIRANKKNEEYYYKWWCELHHLCKVENIKNYLIHSFHEKFLMNEFTFKLRDKAILQSWKREQLNEDANFDDELNDKETSKTFDKRKTSKTLKTSKTFQMSKTFQTSKILKKLSKSRTFKSK